MPLLSILKICSKNLKMNFIFNVIFMKAKVIETGEIVEVYHESQHGQTTIIYKEAVFLNGRMWKEDELDFSVDSKTKEGDFKPMDSDFERDAVSFCIDNGLNTTPYIAKTIAKHFFELGLKAQK